MLSWPNEGSFNRGEGIANMFFVDKFSNVTEEEKKTIQAIYISCTRAKYS